MNKNKLKFDRYCVDNAYIYGSNNCKGIKGYMEKMKYNPTIIAIEHSSKYNIEDAINMININSEYMSFQFDQ